MEKSSGIGGTGADGSAHFEGMSDFQVELWLLNNMIEVIIAGKTPPEHQINF